jgi:hypothetical protein
VPEGRKVKLYTWALLGLQVVVLVVAFTSQQQPEALGGFILRELMLLPLEGRILGWW